MSEYCKDPAMPIERDCPDCVDAIIARLRKADAALRKIAFDPIGPSDATHAEVLDAVTAIAREALTVTVPLPTPSVTR